MVPPGINVLQSDANNAARQLILCGVINPLTTNDEFSRHRNLAACYQLAQSVLKMGSALAERVGQGEVGGATAVADHAWRLLQLAIETARSALDGPLLCFLVQTGVENGPSTL